MTKILNLDTLETDVEKTLVLKGQSHTFRPLSVSEFITAMKEAEARQKAMREDGEEMQPSELAEYMIDQITRAFPTMSAADLGDLPADRLKKILNFVNDIVEEEALAGVTEDETSPKKDEGK